MLLWLFALGKYRYRYRYRKNMENIEEISYRIKKSSIYSGSIYSGSKEDGRTPKSFTAIFVLLNVSTESFATETSNQNHLTKINSFEVTIVIFEEYYTELVLAVLPVASLCTVLN